MTQLLERAVDQARMLPADEQDAIGSLILEEIGDEQAWQHQFDSSHDALARYAEKVRADIRAGRIRQVGIDEL